MGKGTKWWLQHRIDLKQQYPLDDLRSFRYKSSRYESIQVRFTWLKERRIFTQNVFKWSPANYILEDFGIFLQYQRLEFVSKRLVSKRPKSPLDIAPLTSSFFFLFKSQLPEVSVTLPMVIFGILSLCAGLMILRLPETLNSNMCQTIEEANIAKEYYGFMWMGKRVGNPFPCLRWDIARNTLKQVKLYWGVKDSIKQLTY